MYDSVRMNKKYVDLHF